MGNKPTYGFSEFFAEGQYQTQTETLEVARKKQSLTIGVPKEINYGENRVALVPNSVRVLIGSGHKVMVQSGAGEKSNFSDNDYTEAGAIISPSKEEVFKSDVVIKVSPASMEEIQLMQPDKIFISPLHLPVLTQSHLLALKQKRVTAIAMEYMHGEDGSFPVVRIMSELAGTASILTAAELLSSNNDGRGVLLGGISGVPPAKVIILGAGIVGEFATKAALGLGASVRVFDNQVSKLMRIQSLIGRHLHTSTFNPVYLGYQLMSADVVVGAVHSKTGRSPVLVTEEMIMKMKPGAVIIDVSIDQGGVFETSEVTSHKQPTFVKHEVIHYGVPNIASKFPRTSSAAVSNILTPLLIKAGATISLESLLFESKGIRNGVYAFKGCLTNEYLSKRFDIKYTNLDLLLTSKY
jgi:alanine dehydrogenase